MAKASWVKVDPSQGSGPGTVNVSSTAEHTGREPRTSTITWKAVNADSVERTVIQSGKSQYVSIKDKISVGQDGGTVTISGESNAKKLTFRLAVGGDLNITLPSSYIAKSITTANGAEIAGDPGASSKYEFSITVEVPKNEGLLPLARQVIVSDGAGHEAACTVSVAAGDAFLIIGNTKIDLDFTGAPVAVEVRSNTNWTVE